MPLSMLDLGAAVGPLSVIQAAEEYDDVTDQTGEATGGTGGEAYLNIAGATDKRPSLPQGASLSGKAGVRMRQQSSASTSSGGSGNNGNIVFRQSKIARGFAGMTLPDMQGNRMSVVDHHTMVSGDDLGDLDAGMFTYAGDAAPVMQVLDEMPDYPIDGDEIASRIPFRSLFDLLPSGPGVAVYSTDGRSPLTHEELKRFIGEFSLAEFGLGPTDRVALALPNGPELGVAMLAVCSRCCSVPVNPQSTASELTHDLASIGAKALLVLHGQSNAHLSATADALKIPLLSLIPSDTECGIFSVMQLRGSQAGPIRPPGVLRSSSTGSAGVSIGIAATDTFNPSEWTTPDQHALLLHTSGTSGKKKIVPYRLRTIVVGAACIIKGWKLTPEDINLNMMPLFHIGGIARNVFSPVLSGGGVVLCQGFDPTLFWDILDNGTPATWYYASPTMHQAYCEEASRRRVETGSVPDIQIRFIANAAGSLLPALANMMKTTFNCTILPGYGMTECMPISCPPLTYNLERKGSSGRPAGPQVAILDGNGKPAATGTQGNICVRGAPCFDGYEANDDANESSFFPGGWFNTGDLGYFDDDKYLYINGRSKEVINRGGEIISPFEIEEALLPHPDIHKVICFAAAHDTLQETIGVYLVMLEHAVRPDLKALQKFCAKSLHPSKWPQIILFVTGELRDVPRGPGSGKPLRQQLASRAGLPELTEATPDAERLYECKCPPKGTSLKEPIASTKVVPDMAKSAALFKEVGQQLGVTNAVVVSKSLQRGRKRIIGYVSPGSIDTAKLMAAAEAAAGAKGVHRYELPEIVVATDQEDAIGAVINGKSSSLLPPPGPSAKTGTNKPRNQLQAKVAKTWRALLGMEDDEELDVTASFFEIGGTSLMAGQLAALMRREYGITMGVSDVFNGPTVAEMAKLVSAQTKNRYSTMGTVKLGAGTLMSTIGSGASSMMRGMSMRFGRSRRGDRTATMGKGMTLNGKLGTHSMEGQADTQKRSSTGIVPLSVQLLPLLLWSPLRRAMIWICFLVMWSQYMALGVQRFLALLCALATIRLGTRIAMPLLGIFLKWLVMGRYKPGAYPLYGSYYLRWWTTEQMLAICGRGVFAWSSLGLRVYYRMLGASIGANVQIDPGCKIGEADLLDIGADSLIDLKAVVRPFALDKGTMTLRRIRLGKGTSIGIRSVVAPGARLPEGTAIGPLSSSYELESARDENRDYCTKNFPGPRLAWRLFVGWPIIGFVNLVAFAPVLGMLFLITQMDFYVSDLEGSPTAIMEWFSGWERIGYYMAIKVVRECVVPWFNFFAILFVKRAIVGKFRPGPRNTDGGWQSFRHWIMAQLLSDGTLGGVTLLLGKHYDAVSWCLRRMGAKVGKRVYWPGSGVFCNEHDLLSVGDDVVFGSRTTIIAADAKDVAPITIKEGCFVADRCVLLPGTTLERNATLGSGGLAHKHCTLPPGSVAVGSKECRAVLLNPGDRDKAMSEATVRPFGKAFHRHGGFRAPYFVLREWMVVLYHHIWYAIMACWHSMPLVASLVTAKMILGGTFEGESFRDSGGIFVLLFLPYFFVSCILSLLLAVGIKWTVIGTRKVGKQPWDEDNYCQRWQIYLCMEEIRRGVGFGGRGILDFLGGSWYIVAYFRALGATIGSDTCLYPTGGDPMMTEPDLVTINDGACVDDASLISHLNAKGVFSLNELNLGAYSTMRSMSRLLSGASLGDRARLLEHTLIYSGEYVDPGSTWQGWPGAAIGFDIKGKGRRKNPKGPRRRRASQQAQI